MEKTVSATEAVRRFSEILNSVKYRGEYYTIVKSGKPIASIHPVETHFKERTLQELKGILKKLSGLGDDAEKFDGDLKKIIRNQPAIPGKSSWA